MKYENLDERALAGHCQNGDRLAEDELYRRYAAKVYTVCRRYLGDDDEAKDLMQDTLIQALDKIGTYTFTGSGSLYGWISRIAVNKAVNHVRRKSWKIVPLDIGRHDTAVEEDGQDIGVIPQEKLLEWIASMTELRRAVFNLYCIDGYPHKEIAKMLGITEKGSAGVLAKARKQLQQEIKRYLKETGR